MDRRQLLGSAAALLALPAWSRHPWKPYEDTPPVYLEGEVTMIIWAEPHPHLELAQRVGAPLPPDLRRRNLLPHRDAGATAALLGQVALPVSDDRIWRVELPALPQLLRWNVPRPKIGEVLGVVGRPGPPVTGSPTLQAEILYVGARGYPLRSEPS